MRASLPHTLLADARAEARAELEADNRSVANNLVARYRAIRLTSLTRLTRTTDHGSRIIRLIRLTHVSHGPPTNDLPGLRRLSSHYPPILPPLLPIHLLPQTSYHLLVHTSCFLLLTSCLLPLSPLARYHATSMRMRDARAETEAANGTVKDNSRSPRRAGAGGGADLELARLRSLGNSLPSMTSMPKVALGRGLQQPIMPMPRVITPLPRVC